MKRNLLALILCLAPLICAAQEQDAEKYIAEGAVMLFGAGCIKYYPDAKAFETWIKQNTFDTLSEPDAKGLLMEPGGVAYSVNNNGVRYLLVAQATNLCTVYVKEANLTYTREAISRIREKLRSKGWIEKATSNDKALEKGLVVTTAYDYYLDGQREMTVVVTESESKLGFFQLAMSAASLQRANHALKGDLGDAARPSAP